MSGADWSSVPLRGFRKFMVRDNHLTGVTYQFKWLPGTNESVCGRNAQVPAGQRPDGTEYTWDDVTLTPPTADHTLNTCNCGFHAVYPHERFDDYWGQVEGIVEGWGQVITGPLGFRASKTQIVALCFDVNVPPHIDPSALPDLDMGVIERRYGVPVFATREEMVERFPSQQGEYPVEPEVTSRPALRRGGITYPTPATGWTNMPTTITWGTSSNSAGAAGGGGSSRPSGAVATGPTGRTYMVGCPCSGCQNAANGQD